MVDDTTGEQLGVLSKTEAVARAQAKGLDLVLMAAKSNPPVCKIMDYGKFKYEEQKKKEVEMLKTLPPEAAPYETFDFVNCIPPKTK